MHRWSALFIAAALAGCKGPEITSGGEILWDHFPFDGLRTWEYVNTDLAITYKLIGSMREEDPDAELSCGEIACNVYHIDFTVECVAYDPSCINGDLVRTISMSSDANNGVHIHSFQAGPVDVVYDPPLEVAPKEMRVSEAVTTTTDGFDWTSTLVGFEPCPVKMQGPDFERSNCSAHFNLDDGDGSEESNYGLAGDYWAAIGLGIAAFTLEGDDDSQWQLSGRTCEPEDECLGEW